jgi:hypothetical protein
VQRTNVCIFEESSEIIGQASGISESSLRNFEMTLLNQNAKYDSHNCDSMSINISAWHPCALTVTRPVSIAMSLNIKIHTPP